MSVGAYVAWQQQQHLLLGLHLRKCLTMLLKAIRIFMFGSG
jgi:hypothetical protein